MQVEQEPEPKESDDHGKLVAEYLNEYEQLKRSNEDKLVLEKSMQEMRIRQLRFALQAAWLAPVRNSLTSEQRALEQQILEFEARLRKAAKCTFKFVAGWTTRGTDRRRAPPSTCGCF